MLNLRLGLNRQIHNAFLYFHLLDSYLEGVNEQRNRIKQISIKHRGLRSRLPDIDSVVFFEIQKSLFREIHVFFWWWRPIFITLWTGENIKGTGTRTDCLVKILDKSFGEELKKYREAVKDFCDVRDDLEHILERVHNKNYDLGNLSEGNNRRAFQICGKSVDISDDALDFVDVLSSTINQWLQGNNKLS
jgi:hypothetical protein